jgi:formylglycine-generating enzyme required for sulfatase activity
VQVVAPFVMAAAPVTWRQYALMLRDRTVAQGDADKPVVEVSWFEACLFARWLQRQRRRHVAQFGRVLPPEAQAMEFALPSEAQWEYACRAGTTTRFWSDGGDGDSEAALDRVGWFIDNSEHRHRVAEKEPNGWKLFDMHGNVWEWCADWYGDKLGDVVGGPPSGRARVRRGGCYWNVAGWCRSAGRDWFGPVDAWVFLGFRLGLSAPEHGLRR